MSLEELFRSIHSIIEELLPAQNLYFALYEPASDTLTFPYLVDEYDHYPPRKSGRGLTEYVVRSGESLSAPPEILDALVFKGLVERLGTPAIDWFGVPLKSKGKVFGVVAVQSYKEGVRFGEAERSILEFISTQVALAVERKQAEEALQLSQDRYREFVQRIAEGVWRTELVDPMPISLPVDEQIDHMKNYSVVAECNDAMAQMSGFSKAEEMIGSFVRDLDFDSPDNMEFRGEFVHNNYSVRDYEMKVTDRFGMTHYFLCSAVGILKEGFLLGIWGTQRDVTEKKVAEDALRASEERYRLLFERNLAGVFRANFDGMILDGNSSF
ncbi:MAG TPA: GAF domain-containing protein, partial [Anaerolineales bacterium]|nr:GAF domain-containing protein [Anaerolineales bacterium]